MMRFSVVGSPQTVKRDLEQVLSDTQADVIIVTGSMFDHAARLHSFEIAADEFQQINVEHRTANLVPSPSGRGLG
jgi:alkanesulfonate monooxygenase SsuD/methylene tetrahydromethanopterin reductase-like flavin-dependent oxidoreductase (luciferase family)